MQGHESDIGRKAGLTWAFEEILAEGRKCFFMAEKKRSEGKCEVPEKAFRYQDAVAELEKIAAKVEDPATGIDDIDKYIRRADDLISGCRKYLRTSREKADGIETY